MDLTLIIIYLSESKNIIGQGNTFIYCDHEALNPGIDLPPLGHTNMCIVPSPDK